MVKKAEAKPITRQRAAIERVRAAGGKQVSLLLPAEIVERIKAKIERTGDTQTSIIMAALRRI